MTESRHIGNHCVACQLNPKVSGPTKTVKSQVLKKSIQHRSFKQELGDGCGGGGGGSIEGSGGNERF